MGSQGPKMIRLSEPAPWANYDALDDELNRDDDSEKKPQRLNVLGSVQEKGFSIDSTPFERISVPQPRVTPFPVARHRADGPHWGATPEAPPVPAFQPNADNEGEEMSAAVLAEPLHRRKRGYSETSKWRSSRNSDLNISSQTQNVFDDTRQGNRPETCITTMEMSDNLGQQTQSLKPLEVASKVKDVNEGLRHRSQSTNGALQKKVNPERVSNESRLSDATAAVEINQAQSKDFDSSQKHILNLVQMPTESMSVDERSGLGEENSKAVKQAYESGLSTFIDRDIDAENRISLFAMSSEEVAEAQAELSQKIRPELLDTLRKRGAEKERKRFAEKTGTRVPSTFSEGNNGSGSFSGNKKEVIEPDTSSPADLVHAKVAEDVRSVANLQRGFKKMAITVDQTATVASKRMDTVRGTKVGPVDLLTASAAVMQEEVPLDGTAEESTPSPTTDAWTLRVEAVRSILFDLDGSVVAVGPFLQSGDAKSNSAGGILYNSPKDLLSVVERDYLRTEGDPVGAGYSLKDSLALVRSTIPGQRAVALRLITSVLDKAIHSLQDQGSSPSPEGLHEPVDWQAVWAYALGPEAELVLTLRLSLDDGHSTVVAACARAIQALLSYSANESYFDSIEVGFKEGVFLG